MIYLFVRSHFGLNFPDMFRQHGVGGEMIFHGLICMLEAEFSVSTRIW